MTLVGDISDISDILDPIIDPIISDIRDYYDPKLSIILNHSKPINIPLKIMAMDMSSFCENRFDWDALAGGFFPPPWQPDAKARVMEILWVEKSCTLDGWNPIPPGYVKIAIENGHRNSGFTQLQNGDFP